jgi:hypothetical protein
MYQQCVDLVKKYYPNLPEKDYGNLLMGATCFPMGGPEYIEPQLIELIENTDGSLEQALGYADMQQYNMNSKGGDAK